ncbi:MAG: (d)CMP kinase [Tannerellaceae bacterium]|nr:(d)CMP kinase [Tannerellaceae bacterium]MCD8265442.1 (d)CMP kinase [Tannerellaceae bacterium]
MKKIIIAIDGVSSGGKSTMAKDLARELGYIYVDSGAMYRAITLYALKNGLIKDKGVDTDTLKSKMDTISITFSFNPETGRPDTFLNGENVETIIRGMEVSGYVSKVSALDFVRKAVVVKLQEMGKEKGIVMDGRDIGTVVFPEAELKIYLTASLEVRARRRMEELIAKGTPSSYEEVLENLISRDALDMNRTESPLRKADDAIVLDNSDMTIEEQKKWLLEQYKRAAGK